MFQVICHCAAFKTKEALDENFILHQVTLCIPIYFQIQPTLIIHLVKVGQGLDPFQTPESILPPSNDGDDITG